MMADVNMLRKLLAEGRITQEQLSAMRMGGSMGAPNALVDALSEQERFATFGGEDLPLNSMRNEETGNVTYFGPGGASPTPYGRAQAPRRRVRVVGVGGGQVTDLGEEDDRAMPIDFTRPGIEIAGLGVGRYTADGRSAIIQNPDGSKTKVVLGYDREGSERATGRDLVRRKLEAEIARDEEALAADRAQRERAAAPSGPVIVPQKSLEELYGKPDKGMRWTPDGTLEPLPGGEVQEQAIQAAETAGEAVRNIDKMIGRRDAAGDLLPGAKPHEGFEQAVGLGIPGLKFIKGSTVADFNRRLGQLEGGAFLQAFERLKGGGQITQIEGEKATQAITRMSTSQSEDEFVKAATEFRNVLQRGLERATAKGGKAAAARTETDAMPMAHQHPGAVMTDTKTGLRYRSDGIKWVRQ